MRRRAAFLVVQLCVLVACGSTSETGTEHGDSKAGARELPDGVYQCEAANDSTGNGPYSLQCTVSGGSLTIHFSNGGYIDGTIDIAGDGPYDGEATDSRGNSWSITIDR